MFLTTSTAPLGHPPFPVVARPDLGSSVSSVRPVSDGCEPLVILIKLAGTIRFLPMLSPAKVRVERLNEVASNAVSRRLYLELENIVSSLRSAHYEPDRTA
jgi:hypothetical protein